jgi:hypothetical protein
VSPPQKVAGAIDGLELEPASLPARSAELKERLHFPPKMVIVKLLDVSTGYQGFAKLCNPDMGQPTHFLTRRRHGMFGITVPEEYPRTQMVGIERTAVPESR